MFSAIASQSSGVRFGAAGVFKSSPLEIQVVRTRGTSVSGVMVSMVAFQAVDRGSIPR